MAVIVFGFAVMVFAAVGLTFVVELRRVGRLAKRRWQVIRWIAYVAMFGSAAFLTNDDKLGSGRWWLPLSVLLVLAVAVEFPLRGWSKRERARLQSHAGSGSGARSTFSDKRGD